MPTPIPASWLRASVATANPMAAVSVIATHPRRKCAGRASRAARSPIPEMPMPATVAPMAAAMTPTSAAKRSPTASTTPIAANVAARYRLRLSPRTTAVLSVPQVHSDPAIAAP